MILEMCGFKNAPGRPTEEVFNFSRLTKDLAVGVGLGFRVDFSFLLCGLITPIKQRSQPVCKNTNLQNKWFGYSLKAGQQFQLGISYPFIL